MKIIKAKIGRFAKIITAYTFYTKNALIIFIILNTHYSMHTESACIIVHGTWAKDETWYKQDGTFFKAVKSCNDELKIVDKIISFSWSGKLGYNDQMFAAKNLAKLIMTYNFVILICHSHGATVGIISSQIISKLNTNGNNLGKIEKFYALGAPINEESIYPNMSVIKKLYNIFSFGDFVQPVNCAYKRVFKKNEKIVNISAQIDSLHPSHSQLHHPLIGSSLLKIDEFFKKHYVGNFHNFSFSVPGCINFISYCNPIYSKQQDQDYLLSLDKRSQMITNATLFRNKR